MELTFSVTMEEAEKIINHLAKLPYHESYLLINKLQEQATLQIKDTKNDTPQ